MTERELLDLWVKARLQIVVSQLGPTFLLITTVTLTVFGLQDAPAVARWATLGILLASGILGALVQYGAATEGIAIAKDLSALPEQSRAARQVAGFAPWLHVVRFVTPAIFVVIFVLLFIALV